MSQTLSPSIARCASSEIQISSAGFNLVGSRAWANSATVRCDTSPPLHHGSSTWGS